MKLIDTQGREVITASALTLLPIPNAGALDISSTWNGGANPTGIKLNVTDSGAGASALLADLRVGGNSKWSCDKAGNVVQGGSLTVGTVIKGADAVGTNVTGSDLTVGAGPGTGTAHGGSLLLKTAPPWATGNAVPGSLTTRMRISNTSIECLLPLQAGDGATTNAPGADFVLNAGRGNGTGLGGKLIFKAAATSGATESRMEVGHAQILCTAPMQVGNIHFTGTAGFLDTVNNINDENSAAAVLSNYAYTALSVFTSGTDHNADPELTGILAPPTNYCPLLIVLNLFSNDLLLLIRGEDSRSNAANRFFGPNIDLNPNESATFIYCPSLQRWVPIFKHFIGP